MATRHDFDRALLRRWFEDGETRDEMARKLGVARATIYRALVDAGIIAPGQGRASTRRAPIENILARIDTNADHWIWPGRVVYGVAQHSIDPKLGKPHTISVQGALWSHFVGGAETPRLRRQCDVERCVRPSHFLPVGPRGKAWTVGAGERRASAPRVLRPADDRRIRELHEHGLRPVAIALELNVAPDAVRDRMLALGLRPNARARRRRRRST